MAVTDKTLLILDDDGPLRGRLRRAMEVRGFKVIDAGTVHEGVEMVRNTPPAYAILDMKLEDGTGLTLVQELRKKRADCRIVMLTGFGNIATAVAAVKAGAVDYLPKPADPDQITAALTQLGDEMPPPPQDPMSADRVRWEHIQRVYEQCGRNVSETARRLRMHRRTLQRILSKHAPRD
jgi:two-component system response regulator RegA